MSIETAFYTIEFWIGVAVLVAFLYGPWQTFVEAVVRQKMFKVRDDLFDYAAEGNISFDNEHYIRIRSSINGFIRFAHTMTWVNLSIGKRVLSRNNDDNGLAKLLVTDDSLSKEVRDRLNQSVLSCLISMIFLTFLRSPLLMLLLSAMFPVLLFLQVWNSHNYPEKVKKFFGGFLYNEISQDHA